MVLGEEDDVGLDPLAVGREGAARQAEHGVQVAILGDDLEDFARLIGEEAVVGQHHRGPTAGLEDRQDVLDEVQLLVRRADREVVAVGRLVGALGAEGRVRQHDIKAAIVRHLVDRIAELDVRLQAVQHEIHQGQAARPGDQVLAEVHVLLDALGGLAVEGAVLGLAHEPFIRGDEEFCGAAGRVGDGEIALAARIGPHDADDGPDKRPRREVLSRPFLAFAGRFFKQAS